MTNNNDTYFESEFYAQDDYVINLINEAYSAQS